MYQKTEIKITRHFAKDEETAYKKLKEFSNKGFIYHCILLDAKMPNGEELKIAKFLR